MVPARELDERYDKNIKFAVESGGIVIICSQKFFL